MNQQMTVSVIASHGGGHRLYYLGVLLRHSVKPIRIVTTEEVAQSRDWAVQVDPFLTDRHTIALTNQRASRREQLDLAAHDAEAVLHLDGDRWTASVLYALVTWPTADTPRAIRLLLIRPPRLGRSVHEGVVAVLKACLIALISLLGKMRAVKVEVFFLGDAFSVTRPRYLIERPFVRDPVEFRPRFERHEARRHLGLPTASVLIGLIGAIDRRKNPDLCIRAVRRLPPGEEYRLVLAGQLSTEVQRTVLSWGDSTDVITATGYLDEEDLARYAASCDIVLAMYDNHHSPSGILALCAQQGVPVVVPRDGLLAEIATSLGIGMVSSFEEEELSRVIRAARESSEQLSSATTGAARRLGVASFVRSMGVGGMS